LLVVMPGPIPLRAAKADVVVVGKVTKIEDKTVSAPAFPGAPNKVEYQIAVVKVDDPILNAKGVKEIRVGFQPANPGVIRPGGYRPVTLVEDEEALLFLTKAPEGDFYLMPVNGDAVKKANNESYDKDIKEAKKAAKLLEDTTAGLKAKDAEDRFVTAAMLIERYRTRKPPFTGQPKEEPIDAAESKLILEALRDADWTPPQPKAGAGMPLTPLNTFYHLGLTKDDKWEPPVVQPGAPFDPTAAPKAAQAWLKDNAGTYRIKKFVPEQQDGEKKDKVPEKKDK
jgi:hypothetical protein